MEINKSKQRHLCCKSQKLYSQRNLLATENATYHYVEINVWTSCTFRCKTPNRCNPNWKGTFNDFKQKNTIFFAILRFMIWNEVILSVGFWWFYRTLNWASNLPMKILLSMRNDYSSIKCYKNEYKIVLFISFFWICNITKY